MDKKIFSLNGTWNLDFTLDEKSYNTKITVPSNVEPTLQQMGLCDDYMPADYEFATAKFETVDDWTYTTVFDAPELPEGYTRNLVFEGIDTLAEIYLNGEKLGNTENMHMSYRFAVDLKPTGNELKVIIRSVDLWARENPHDEFSRPLFFQGHYDGFINVRKNRLQWGWDNAPRIITSGIIRDVYIEDLPPKRFEEMYVYTNELYDDYAILGISYIYKTPVKVLTDHRLRVSLLDGDEVINSTIFPARFVQGLVKFGVERSKIELWWPSGFGNPKLYDLKIEMLEGEDCVALYTQKYGIRTIDVIHTDDINEDGTGEFLFRVNGENVFLRGTGWKPRDPFASEADKKTKTLDALKEMSNLHCNFVRVLGVGIYEDKSFFDYCDAHGIMVWQDFMFACEIPSMNEEYGKLVAKEAEQVVKKYRNHTCLALWCGDNECDKCVEWVQPTSQILPSQVAITRKIIPDIVVRFDPYRPYIHSSPVSSDRFHGSRHTRWTWRDESTFLVHTDKGVFSPTELHFYVAPHMFGKALRESKNKIFSEIAPGPLCAISNDKATFEREKSRMERLWNSPRLDSNGTHQNDGYFTVWRNAGKFECEHFFGRDFTLDEWKEYALAVNLLCAEGYKDAIEYSRTVRWSKTGVIWWSLCDMWPMAFNYSVMDYKLGPKLPYFWIERSQQEFLLAAVKREADGEIALYALNDTLEKRKVSYSVKAYDQSGKSRIIATGTVSQEKNSSSLIQRIYNADESELWIITWSNGEREYKNHAFTGKANWETMKNWVKIIADEFGITDKVAEIN